MSQICVRSADGLFVTKDGAAVDADPNVVVTSGALEGSNVNVIDTMVNMISLQRQFDTQMKLLQSAENNSEKANQIFGLTDSNAVKISLIAIEVLIWQ